MGRKEDPIWAFFKKIDVDGRKRAQCTQCLEDIVPLVERMRSHQDKCKSPAGSDGPSEAKKLKQQTLGFKGTKPNIPKIFSNYLLFRMIVATNSSFNAANNKQLKKLVSRWDSILPLRKQLEHWLHLWPPQLAWRDSSQRLA